ncbi:MAG: hypothetical protein H0X41_01280 [Chitinophagaceae bacterium]|nr:hypothetical protein [Chitinophagaceae bacterium]
MLYIIKNSADSTFSKYFIENKKYNENLTAKIIYYKPFSRIRAIDSLFAGLRYFLFFVQLIRHHIAMHGKPDLIMCM